MRAPELTVEQVQEICPNCSQIEFVGKGGQKTVFSGLLEGKQYAIKFLDLTSIQNQQEPSDMTSLDLQITVSPMEDIREDVLARAKREIDIMDRCETPTLVKLGPISMTLVEYDNKKLLYFTEEFITGDDLYTILRREKQITVNEGIELGIDIATAIKHLWNINMVHRDVKPRNIMRRSSGSYVLLDTGLAFDLSDESLTAAFMTVGTPIYMSPEQLRNVRRGIDFRSDLFLLGIVLYEVLTGQHPFFNRGINSMQLVANIISNQVEPPNKIRSDIPNSLNAIIMRLLAKEPHLRFKTCDSLIAKLQHAREEV
ncbi:serine/threonine protein kinase [Paenibacillus alginolyticus]|uniref:Serine/threonine protein kinase n=1 Tax=Paenibacillus alginolyticus TaxID=59839 RepID=A0ABT4G7W8_9BACL|nr:serine/threonine-protein kinase [Paenibacillus alginolyticus]MCY9692270.1 serine/threonine protein kinase [Paenibacillus alginolyticus]MEC0145888.1 serine/threonine-protein kinase [Paenibacillus alginolyticus]